MNLHLAPDRYGNLVVRQTGVPVLRFLIGVPLLIWGGLMLYGVFSSFILTLQSQGSGGVFQALVGSFLLAVFAAMVLPLGWWLVFSRHWITLEAGPADIVEVSDWKLGRKEKRTPTEAFKSVRLALEPLSASSSSRVNCQAIRLLAMHPRKQVSLQLGSLDKKDLEQAIDIAQQVSRFLKLPLEIADPDEILLSPERAAEDKASRRDS